jgi:cell division protein FtsB
MKKSTINKPRTNFKRYQQQAGKRKGFHRLLLGIIILIILFVFFTGNRSLFKLYSLYNQKQTLDKQKESLMKENQEIREEIEKLKNDDKYIEKLAREKYNMKKEGEEIYHIESE